MEKWMRCLASVFTLIAALCLDSPLSWGGNVPNTNSLPIEQIVLIGARSPMEPVAPVIGDGKAHVAYELYLTNYGRKAARIVSLRVRGVGGAAFETTIEGESLRRSYAPDAAKSRAEPHDPVLQPGTGGMLFVFLNFAGREAPRSLDNSIVVQADGDSMNAQRITLADISVARSAPAPVGEPLTGSGWLAANGPSNTSSHRRAVIVLDGKPRVPERYAIDFIKMGADGNSYSGDQHKNASYHAYNAPVLAVHDGRIIIARDGLPQNVPHTEKLAVTLTLDTIAGNHIVQDIGGGRYVGYAHLIPGTIAVKAGEQVHRGQLLGRLGNSGNSSEPHLHIQICDRPSFLICEGVPMEFERMGLSRYRIEKHGETPVKLIRQGTSELSGEEPMEDELVNFPAPEPDLK
jgi:Peptidase family M23